MNDAEKPVMTKSWHGHASASNKKMKLKEEQHAERVRAKYETPSQRLEEFMYQE